MKNKNPYKESIRYIENARETLKQAGKEDKFYKDIKYVHTACGTAYIGMLKALDFLFDIKKVPKKRGRKSIEFYQIHLIGIDRKLLNHVNTAYRILHLDGYYSGENSVAAIEVGLSHALSVINALKPYSKNGS